METISKKKGKGKGLPVLNKNIECNFEGYDASLLMSETAKLRNLIIATTVFSSQFDIVGFIKYWIINCLTASKCLSYTTIYYRFTCIIVINVGRQNQSSNLLVMAIVAFLNYH